MLVVQVDLGFQKCLGNPNRSTKLNVSTGLACVEEAILSCEASKRMLGDAECVHQKPVLLRRSHAQNKGQRLPNQGHTGRCPGGRLGFS